MNTRGRQEILMARLSDIYPVKEEQPDIQEIKDRLMTVQSLDAYRCLDEMSQPHQMMVIWVPSLHGISAMDWWSISYIDMVGIGCR